MSAADLTKIKTVRDTLNSSAYEFLADYIDGYGDPHYGMPATKENATKARCWRSSTLFELEMLVTQIELVLGGPRQ